MGSYDEPKSLLEALEAVCNIDVDSVDPDVARALPFKAHNRKFTGKSKLQTKFLTMFEETSNQVICCDTMLAPKNRELFLNNVQKYGNQGWEEVFNRVVSRILIKLTQH